MRLPRAHRFRGKLFRFADIKSRDDRGGCLSPNGPNPQMDIPLNGKELIDLDTIIHESVHACVWDLDEEAVAETADSIAKLLWRLGWRKVK